MSVNVLRDNVTGVKEFGITRNVIVSAAATKTMQAGDSGAVIIDTLGSGTSTFTLPLAARNLGVEYTFICGNVSGEILITPNAADKISVKAANAGASVLPAAGTGVKNTAGTNVLNDYITLVSDGVTTWHTIAISGIFASQ